MFFLKRLKSTKYKKLNKFNLKKKVYLKKNLKRSNIKKLYKKKIFIFKIKTLIFKYKKYLKLKYKKNFFKLKFFNIHKFIYKYLKLNNGHKSNFFKNHFYFINIIKKKNNIFLNITNIEKKTIYKNSLKNLNILKKKRDIYKKKFISRFFLKCLSFFFKEYIFDNFNIFLPNLYILKNQEQEFMIKKLIKIFLRIIYFSVTFSTNINALKLKKFNIALKRTLNFLKSRRKIKFLYINYKYKKVFNGCRLKKLKRL